MFKFLVILINLVAVLFLNTFFQTPVLMDVSVPATVNGGTSFEITVTVNKSNLSSFSRYIQELPAGLTATASNSANADFTFKDQKVRLIWLKLPQEENITFSYNVNIDQRLKGDFNLGSMFSYIENNERKSVNTQTPVITIIPSPEIPAGQLVDINEFGNSVIQDLTPRSAADVACYRQKPVINETRDGIIVNLIINKGDKDKFAKIEETVPSGYDAIALDDKEAIFSYKNNQVKFLWMNLPAESYFNVSYKLVPNAGTTINENPYISGTFSYIEDDKTISLDIVQEEFELTDKSENEIKQIFAQLNSGDKITSPPDNKDINTEKTVVEPAEEKPTFLASENKEKTTTKKATVKRKAGASKSDLLKPEDGIYYRVQIAAGHKAVNIRQYFRKFNLEKMVKKEMHDGWHKYSVGSFKLYKEARDYRNYIWRTTIIDDAFVSAYNSGKRITVQEALMIANQQWYK